jgi:sugar transferase (PEP-CTERM system associated)
MIIDATIIVAAFHVAMNVSYAPELVFSKMVLVTAVLGVCFYYAGLYEDRTTRRRLDRFLRFGQTYIAALVILAVVYYVFPTLRVGRSIQAIMFPVSLAGILLWRELYAWLFQQTALRDKVLILGTGATARYIAREAISQAPLGYEIEGFLGEHPGEVGRVLVNPSVIGTLDDLMGYVNKHAVTLIVVALEDRRRTMPVRELLQCRLSGIRVQEAPSFYETLTGRILISNLRPSWIVFSQGFHKPPYLLISKRVVEALIALVLLVLLAPLFGVLALLIKLESRGTVFYRQERVGEGGNTFSLCKLRTMRSDAESKTGPVWATAEADSRITKVGYWLRKLRLDELPQLWNVVRGEMSFVGPRPERPYFVDQLKKVIPYYDERHGVKPGITGWAQVKYRYGSTIEDTEAKLEHDLYYIKHMSPLLDLAIVIDTVKVMFLGKGAR